MVPDFRRDDVWMPDQVRHDGKGWLKIDTNCSLLILHCSLPWPFSLLDLGEDEIDEVGKQEENNA